jgi:alkyl sulfatase BDS1-like metallo-beta-lactamase superfamily hydrolase
VFEAVILGQRTLADALDGGKITTSGNVNAVRDLWALLVDFPSGFPIVAPAGGSRE